MMLDFAIDLLAEVAGEAEVPLPSEQIRLVTAVQELTDAAATVGDLRMLGALLLLSVDFDLLGRMDWPLSRAAKATTRLDLLALSRALRSLEEGADAPALAAAGATPPAAGRSRLLARCGCRRAGQQGCRGYLAAAVSLSAAESSSLVPG